jgi:hypothetical protein
MHIYKSKKFIKNLKKSQLFFQSYYTDK